MNVRKFALLCALSSAAALYACSGKGSHQILPEQSHQIGVRGFSTSNVPNHLLTAIYGTGYAGKVGPTIVSGVPIPGATYSQQAPYLTWAYTDPSYISNYHNAVPSVKTIDYTTFWLNQLGDQGYQDLTTTNAGAIATDCSGNRINQSTTTTAYLSDPHKTPYSLNHANDVVHSVDTAYDAVFGDNTAVFGNVTTKPCDYSTFADWVNNTNTIDGQITLSNSSPAQFFLNTLGGQTFADDPVTAADLASPSNVLGLECEACYIDNRTSPYKVGDEEWQERENAEIATVQKQKIFWDYARNCGDASSSADLRIYELASFLLTYDPSYAMLQECFIPSTASTNTDFAVMPESQFVPEMPTVTGTSVSAYQKISGTSLYVRQFQDCYYQSSLVGSCAVVVNSSSSSSYTIPTSIYDAYTNNVAALNSDGVLDGGTVSFNGTKTQSLQPLTGEILVNKAPYTSDVLNGNPTRFYKLDDASGPAATDYSSNKANGTYLSNVTFGETGPILTETSKAISVPGSSSSSNVSQGVSANVPSGGFASSGSSWTAETWVKPTLLSSSNQYDSYYTLWGQDIYHRLLMSSTSGQLLLEFDANSSGCSVASCHLFSTAKLTSGAWHYIVVTYNAATATAQLYVDGAADASETFSVTTNAELTGTTMYIGQYDIGAYYKWNGALADWAFYPSALSSATVSQHYTDAGY